MKRFIATLALLAGLTHAAPITMLDVPDNTPLYDSSDPFAIGVSTAAYTSATNANALVTALQAVALTDASAFATAAQGAKADTALQPASVAGWETGPHLDWLLPGALLSYTQITNAPWLTAGSLPSGIVTNYGSAVLSELSIPRSTNAVSASTFVVEDDGLANAGALGTYYYKDATHSTNAAGWSLYYEGYVSTRYISRSDPAGTYTILGGSLPKASSYPGIGVATGVIILSQGSLPVNYLVPAMTTNGLEGAALRTASVPPTALSTAPLYPTDDGSQLTGITAAQVGATTPEVVTNIAQALGTTVTLMTATNYLGVVTQQVWTIGGGTVTNFFTEWPARVPQTGQTTVYAVGDNGTYQSGIAWPSPRFTILSPDAATNQIRDNLTGLVWARNWNVFGATTNWLGAFTVLTNSFITASYGGRTDWRIPTLFELKSLFDARNINPAMPTGHPFLNVQNGVYWSGTSVATAPTTRAWVWQLGTGYDDIPLKSTSAYSVFVAGP